MRRVMKPKLSEGSLSVLLSDYLTTRKQKFAVWSTQILAAIVVLPIS
jgi:hypothetical protein